MNSRTQQITCEITPTGEHKEAHIEDESFPSACLGPGAVASAARDKTEHVLQAGVMHQADA